MKKNLIAVLLISIIVLMGIFIVVVLYLNKPTEIKLELSEEDDGVNSEKKDYFQFDTIDEQTEEPVINIAELTDLVGKEKIVVDWFSGAKKASDEEMQKIIYDKEPIIKEINGKTENNCLEVIPETYPKDAPLCPIYLYQVGIVKSPESIKDKTLYLFLFGRGEMGFDYFVNYAIYDDKIGKLILLAVDKENKDEIVTNYYKLDRFVGGFVYDENLTLKYPYKIKIPNQSSYLLWEKPARKNDSMSGKGPYFNYGGIYDAAKSEIVKTLNKEDVIFVNDGGLPVYLDEGNFQIQLADGAIHFYSLIPYFFTTDELSAQKDYYPLSFAVKVTWTNGNNKKDQYELGGDTGLRCGAYVDVLTNTVNKKEWFSEEKLVEIGKTSKNEKIYELADKATNSYYKEFYKFTANETDVDYTSAQYKEFINDTPVFFWKDGWGNWHVYIKNKYKPMAECGKPVIYLYPEKDTDVKVEVKPNGGFTKTEPMYDNGWFVRATPQSELFNYTDKMSYPYLFWEGKAYNFITPNYGFVMSKKDVGTKMTQILAKLGLNEKETSDFLEFWQPKLEVKPYVFVTFLPQREFDKLAPLTVNPKPDTIIRVFMDYTPLDAPIKVAPMYIHTPERIGFTVVEWGGRLH